MPPYLGKLNMNETVVHQPWSSWLVDTTAVAAANVTSATVKRKKACRYLGPILLMVLIRPSLACRAVFLEILNEFGNRAVSAVFRAPMQCQGNIVGDLGIVSGALSEDLALGDDYNQVVCVREQKQPNIVP